MSLRDKFKTDNDAAREGVWFEFPANSDGTVPAIKLARMSRHNKRYTLAMRRMSSKYETESGVADFSSLSEDQAEALLLDVFIDTVLIDWRNIQPEDDGEVLAYSKEAAKQLLGDPSWLDLYTDLNEKARRAASFRGKQLEAQAKN
jgi:hypothetical protein